MGVQELNRRVRISIGRWASSRPSPRRSAGAARPGEVRPRPADRLLAELGSAGLRPAKEEFRGYSTFAAPFALILGLAVAPVSRPAPAAAHPGRDGDGGGRRTRDGGVAAHGPDHRGALAADPAATWSRRSSPPDPSVRTLCLMAHMDTSRSGLIFHPRVVSQMTRWIAANSLMVIAVSAPGALAARSRARPPPARRNPAFPRGEPGACSPSARSAASTSRARTTTHRDAASSPPWPHGWRPQPLESTRVVVLITGCEESGTPTVGLPRLPRNGRLDVPQLRQCGRPRVAFASCAARASSPNGTPTRG